ncbi:hypothetical protein [Enterococcus durans]|uniref:hypothetical protein n=1 Tax=Enterococcus durans TaxID=53345 RepID=UPI003BEEF281
MANPNWNKSLKEVLGHETQEVTLVSPKTGNEYKTDIIPQIKLYATSAPEEVNDGKYRYAVVDANQNLEYAIKTEKHVEAQFGTILLFKNLRGGATNQGGWYAADHVEVVSKNA